MTGLFQPGKTRRLVHDQNNVTELAQYAVSEHS